MGQSGLQGEKLGEKKFRWGKFFGKGVRGTPKKN